MSKKHVQAELAPHEYAAFLRIAERQHLSVKEGAREAILSWVRERGWKDDPFFSILGAAGKKGSRDASERHDDLYLED